MVRTVITCCAESGKQQASVARTVRIIRWLVINEIRINLRFEKVLYFVTVQPAE